MKQFVSIIITLCLLLMAQSALAVETEEQIIRRSEWPTYVNGSSVSALPQVRRILSQFDENDRMNIIIHYPGGEQGTSWARQLYNWFISYGVPIRYLKMELGSGAADQLRVVLVNRG